MSRRFAIVALAGVIAAAAGCGREPSPPPPPPVAAEPSPPPALGSSLAPDRRAAAEALIVRFECLRCHPGPRLAVVAFEQHCVDCHRSLRDGTDLLEAPAADVARWRANVKSLLVVPSLSSVGARLRRDWVAGLLLRPVDARPHLLATMPRLALTAADAALLAEYLVPEEQAALDLAGADAARGRTLFGARGCAACHAMTGVEPAAAPPLAPDATLAAADARTLAPDLGLAADRLQRGRIVDWLRAPQRLVPGTLMPDLGLDARDARDLAAFLLSTPPPRRPPPAAVTRLPLLERSVEFAEVAERVFRKVCWHCHSAPFYAAGDGGPGNTGGFGFAPRGLDLSTHSGVMSGSIGDDGRRRGIFAPTADGTPKLVAHLVARRLEEQGGELPGVRGMPLGLPAMSLEDIQLVETWIEQGRAE